MLALKDPAVRRKELEAEWDERFGNATEAAMKGEIDDVIPSDELLAHIASSLEMLSMKDAGIPHKAPLQPPTLRRSNAQMNRIYYAALTTKDVFEKTMSNDAPAWR